MNKLDSSPLRFSPIDLDSPWVNAVKRNFDILMDTYEQSLPRLASKGISFFDGPPGTTDDIEIFTGDDLNIVCRSIDLALSNAPEKLYEFPYVTRNRDLNIVLMEVVGDLMIWSPKPGIYIPAAFVNDHQTPFLRLAFFGHIGRSEPEANHSLAHTLSAWVMEIRGRGPIIQIRANKDGIKTPDGSIWCKTNIKPVFVDISSIDGVLFESDFLSSFGIAG